jgi:hypothetical protein
MDILTCSNGSCCAARGEDYEVSGPCPCEREGRRDREESVIYTLARCCSELVNADDENEGRVRVRRTWDMRRETERKGDM